MIFDRMRRSRKKGTIMNHILTRSIVGCGCVVLGIGLVLWVSSAFAASPPHFDPKQRQVEVYPTRLRVVAVIVLPEILDTVWQASYSTSASGPWTEVNSGTARDAGGTSVEIGSRVKQQEGYALFLRHLEPGTLYFVRFHAENANGSDEEVVELRTLPVGKPEICRPESGHEGCRFEASGPRSAHAEGEIESNGAPTDYEFGYATSESDAKSKSGSYTLCEMGTISEAEDFAFPEVTCLGLKPETEYFGRVSANNEKGEVFQVKSFRTRTARPQVSAPSVRNVTASSAHVSGTLIPQGSETNWRLEYATAEAGPWEPEPIAEGTVSQTQAEALEAKHEAAPGVEGELTGLLPAKTYYVRLFAENNCAEGCGEGQNFFGEPISTANLGIVESFETAGPPVVGTFAVHAIHGESLRVMGSVNPRSDPTSAEQTVTIEGSPTGGTFSLTFDGQTTGPIARDASAETVRRALAGLASEPEVEVGGGDGGPYTVLFSPGGKDGRKEQPQIEADGSGLTPSGSVKVAVTQRGGEAYDTHYHFEYVGEKVEGTGWSNAELTPTVDLGSGDSTEIVAADLPGLTPGETYRYRIVATNTSPGNPVVDGAERTLTVPSVTVEPRPVCGNERFRNGLSGHLPDCRTYEQISPVDKAGAQEAFKYGITNTTGTAVGEDGNHFMFMSRSTRWGDGPTAGQAPYFFTREEGVGWRMTAGSPQPEAGFQQYLPQVLPPDLSALGLSSQWTTGLFAGGEMGVSSTVVEFKAGPAGGPYVTVASVPRAEASHPEEGWVAASEDFSKLILGVEDHTLLGHGTGTKQGMDLYEYSGGELRQVNVDSGGHTIGSCGASVVKGAEGSSSNRPASRHAVSADGSRVFFEAVPGSNCGAETSHLYVREASAGRTVDIGAYKFAGANSQGNEVLLEKLSGETSEFFLYRTETGVSKPAFSIPGQALGVTLSRDFTTIVISSTLQLAGTEAPPTTRVGRTTNLYSYDIRTGTLRFIVQAIPPLSRSTSIRGDGELSPDGRFFDFQSVRVSGLPGGGPELHEGGSVGPEPSEQLYRYDSTENTVVCISCASPYDPEPRLRVDNTGGSLGAGGWGVEGQPEMTFASSDGNYAFFVTPSALAPEDNNGEIPPAPLPSKVKSESEREGGTPSNDVYEWRRGGVDGCARLAGCLSLITPGTDGFLVSLLGTASDGRDVFIYTSSKLLPQDNDTAGDFYDARVGGGIPEAVKPVECEGDACLSPLVAPIDTTPASLSFSGPGNPTPSSQAKLRVVLKPCGGKHRCRRGKGRARKHGVGRTGRRAGKHSRGGHR